MEEIGWNMPQQGHGRIHLLCLPLRLCDAKVKSRRCSEQLGVSVTRRDERGIVPIEA